MGTKHGKLMRGYETAGKRKKTFDGIFGARFGRLFNRSHRAKFGKTAAQSLANLTKLADAMVSGIDLPKDGPDGEESGIPSLYTYFGQFVDHDLTFDPSSSFQKQKDPDATEDFRTPAFDLDNVYGRGPGDQPYLYDSDGVSFLLGDPITQGTNDHARDLQRNAAGRALIGDPRNDENAIVSQLQGLFQRFHNRVVRETKQRGKRPDFEDIQTKVRSTYQYIVINDFLPRIVNAAVLNRYKTKGVYDVNKLKVFKGFTIPFMPVEFSVAAYRLGHSMVRPGYRLNDTVLLPIFPLVNAGFPEGLTGFRRLISDWALDWGRFIDIDRREYGSQRDENKVPPTNANFKRLQLAYRIDTALVDPLSTLPKSVAVNPDSLPLRNLKRGAEFGLPSGQTVAKLLNVPVLKDEQILIGQGVDRPSRGSLKPIDSIDKVFKNNCPLWTYILAEAMHHKVKVSIPVIGRKKISTPQLGPVGGSIVAEVFLGLMFADEHSYLSRLKTHPDWAPERNKHYGLKDFVEYALH